MADPKPWEVEYEDPKPWEVEYEKPVQEQGSLIGKSKDELSQLAKRLRVERNLGELEQGATDVATGFLSIPGSIGSKIFNIPTELPKSVSKEYIDAQKVKQTLDPITEAWGMSGEPITEATKEFAAETAAGLSTPEAAGIMATGPAAPAIFAAQMAKGAPEAIQRLNEVSKTGDEKETAKAFLNAALSIGGPIAIARQAGLVKEPATDVAQPKETDARTQQEAATVHGDVLPLPVEGEGKVPVKEGESRVQPKTEGGLPKEEVTKPQIVDEPTASGESARFTAKVPEGYATGFVKGDTAELVGIEVGKESRGKGIGKNLLQAFAEKAKNSGATSISGDFVPAAKAMMDKAFGKPISEAPVTDWPEGSGPAPIRAKYSIVPKEPEVTPASTLESVIRDTTQRANNKNSTEAGMAVRSVKDLDALLALRDKLLAESKELFKKAEAEIDPAKKMELMNQGALLGVKSQLPREAIEVATNIGSWKETPEKNWTNLGERPLEHTKNPEVVDWLNKNKRIFSEGVELPKPSEKPVVKPATPRPTGRGLQLKQPSAAMSEAGAINLGIAHDLFDAASDKFDFFSKMASGHSAPKTSHASEASGNALVRYASANQAAPYLARSMTSEVLGNFRKDKAFRERLGAVLVEDRLRAIKKGLVDALSKSADPKEQATLKQQIGNVNTLVGKGKVFADESAFRDAVSDPDIAAAIERHKATVQKQAELYHGETGGQMAGPGLVTGAFVNLEALHEDVPGMVFGKGAQGDYSRPFKKKTVFGRKALGSAAKYELDYDRLAERMIRGNFEEYAKRQMYDQLQKDGLAVLLEPGMPRPEIGDKPAVKFQVERRGQPWGGTKVENLWVRQDIAPEVRQALNIEGPIKDAAAAKVANVLNKIQLAGPTDAVWHSANIINSIAGQQGGKSFLVDLARKVPGINYADAMVRVGMRARDILRDDPLVVKEISDLAQIGATRPESLNARGPLSRMINLLDKSGRLVRNDLYNNLVERGIVENTEAARREFVNKVGQYNPRLMGRFQRFFKEAGISPFIVAGRNFNRLAFQKATLDPGFKATTLGSAAQSRALEAFGNIATLIAVPALLNQLSVGNPNGRNGVPFGMIDTGKNNNKGDPIVVDPAQWIGLRRGMRLTGMNAILNGLKGGKSARQIESDVGRDIKGAIIHPWSGPAVQAGSVLATGYTPTGFKESQDPGDYKENVLGALKNLNPVVHSVLKENMGTSLGGAFGVKSVSGRSSFQEIKDRAQDWGLKNSDPKIKSHYESLAKSHFPPGAFSEIRTELRTGDDSKIVQSINKVLSLEPDSQKQNARMKQILKEFQPFVVNEDGSGHVKPFATDSKAHEKIFLSSQDEEGKALWREALKERVDDYRKLTKALYGRAKNPPIPEQYKSLYSQ